jgi:endonuclease/exonuclease/phosphatase family metal-dependent hydrolase
MKLVSLAARGLAELQDDELRGNQLNLELEVSVWLRRSGAELSSAPRALLALRGALLEVSSLDVDKEPIPLVIPDTQQAVPNLCIYLHGLVGRGAASIELERREFVEVALAHLDAAAATRLTS